MTPIADSVAARLRAPGRDIIDHLALRRVVPSATRVVGDYDSLDLRTPAHHAGQEGPYSIRLRRLAVAPRGAGMRRFRSQAGLGIIGGQEYTRPASDDRLHVILLCQRCNQDEQP